MIRIWSALMTDAGVVADIRDVDTEAYRTEAPAPDVRRPWAWLVWDSQAELAASHTERVRRRECLTRCCPADPCRKCQAHAREWWVEWARRKAAQQAREQVGGAR